MIHLSLDLETWGTTPGSDIRSIGAVVFDPLTGYVGRDGAVEYETFYIACNNPYSSGTRYGMNISRQPKYMLTRDPRTEQWWSEQSDEAQAAFADPVDLREALRRLIVWLAEVTGCGLTEKVWERTDLRIWSHGAAFDPPILAAAYKAVGLPVPWHYRAPRDTRTLFDVAGIDDHTAWLKQHPGPLGVPHHALDDAICQARAVCAAWDIVQQWHNYSGVS